jgi:HAE1 family hydrophobic/amphiphilic exporter-1
MWFTQVSLRNPVFATMVMLAIVVLGIFSYQRLQIDQFPSVDFPVVVVYTAYPGASPEIVETDVSKKIEEALNTVSGINTITSRSYQGTSVVIAEFQLSVESRKAAEDVREKIAQLKASLRDDVEEPRVLRFDPASRPIFSLAIISDATNPQALDEAQTTAWADQVLRKKLENVRGVGAVSLVGSTERAIKIELNTNAMRSLGVGTEQVIAAIRSDNQNSPVGVLSSESRETVVQIQARIERPENFANIIVAKRGNTTIRLNQVANITDGLQDVESLALYNGKRTVLLEIQKAQDENTIDITDKLKAQIEVLRADLPPGLSLEAIGDSSRPIRVSVNNVKQTLIEGAFLTIAIVFLFLNSWRSTVITGLTLPIALIGTFLFMYLFGFTINMITLMALSLCVGLLIDDAIVVRENIVRHVKMGKDPYTAAMDGTQEIGLAVLATTLSIVAVFAPIGFMGGIIGKFFHQFGITIVAAVLISMFVSFTLDPMLSSIWHDPAIDDRDKPFKPNTLYNKTIGRVTHAFDVWQENMVEGYQGILAWSLRHKVATLGVALATFLGSIAMMPLLGTEFVPKADFSETRLNFYTPVGSSLETTEAKVREVEAVVRSFPEVDYTLSTINTGSTQGKMYANMYVRLVDRDQRTLGASAMSASLRERLRGISGITVTHVGILDPFSGNKQIELSVTGPDLRELERVSLQVMARIEGIPGLVDLDSSVKPNKPTVDVTLKRDAANDLGLSVGFVAHNLRTLIAGQTVSTWSSPDGQNHNVIVRLPASQRTSIDDIRQLPFVVGTNTDGTPRVVSLEQVANIESATGANQINRRNLTREVAINANAYARSVGEVSGDIRKSLDAMQLPPGYRYEFGGSTKDMAESFGYAISALVLAVLFIYMILASQFKSFLQPLALMSALPLTLIGVVLALLMFQSSVSMFSVIGIVMLMGLVTKNAILLVDFAIRARAGTPDTPPMGRTEALLMAAKVRLRPILMTTLAMIFGMIPLAFALSEGSEQRAPMGQAVIGGVITASLLTLVVVPVVYCYMDDLGEWLKRKFSSTPSNLDVDVAT